MRCFLDIKIELLPGFSFSLHQSELFFRKKLSLINLSNQSFKQHVSPNYIYILAVWYHLHDQICFAISIFHSTTTRSINLRFNPFLQLQQLYLHRPPLSRQYRRVPNSSRKPCRISPLPPPRRLYRLPYPFSCHRLQYQFPACCLGDLLFRPMHRIHWQWDSYLSFLRSESRRAIPT